MKFSAFLFLSSILMPLAASLAPTPLVSTAQAAPRVLPPTILDAQDSARGTASLASLREWKSQFEVSGEVRGLGRRVEANRLTLALLPSGYFSATVHSAQNTTFRGRWKVDSGARDIKLQVDSAMARPTSGDGRVYLTGTGRSMRVERVTFDVRTHAGANVKGGDQIKGDLRVTGGDANSSKANIGKALREERKNPRDERPEKPQKNPDRYPEDSWRFSSAFEPRDYAALDRAYSEWNRGTRREYRNERRWRNDAVSSARHAGVTRVFETSGSVRHDNISFKASRAWLDLRPDRSAWVEIVTERAVYALQGRWTPTSSGDYKLELRSPRGSSFVTGEVGTSGDSNRVDELKLNGEIANRRFETTLRLN